MMKVVPALLFAGAAAFVSTSTLRDARADASFKVPVVTVHASEFAFALPKSITAGLTTVRLVNDGKEIHQISILKLATGKTMKDAAAAMNDPAAVPPAWMVPVGGPNAAGPGETIEATLDFAPGEYVLMCFIPSPGGNPTPHSMKGMVAPLTVSAAKGVTQAGATFAPTPTPDVHLVLKDYGFVFSKPITAGKHTIHVMNDGPQDHEAVMIKLAPGKHLDDFNKWVATMQGPPVAAPMPGLAGMAKGRTATFTADFTPGGYALICYIMSPDKKPHFLQGMTMEFEVK